MLNKISILLLLISVSSSCSQNSNELSGYIRLESEISSDVVTETFLPPHVLIINEKGNVLEFNEKLNNSSGKYNVSDTLNVFFINTKKGLYSAYKKLDENEKPYLTENVVNKKEGASFFSNKVDFFTDVQNIKVKDTIINNTKYKFVSGSKKTDNTEQIYEAFITSNPRNFPVQISKILSALTDGGFVEKIRIIDKSNNRIISFNCIFEKKELPERIKKIMKVWSEN